MAGEWILRHGDVATAFHRVFYRRNAIAAVSIRNSFGFSRDGQHGVFRLDGVNISPVFCLACAVGVLVGVGHGSATVMKTEIIGATCERRGQLVTTPVGDHGHHVVQQVRRYGVAHTGDGGVSIRRHIPPFHNNIDGESGIDATTVYGVHVERFHRVIAYTKAGGNGQRSVCRFCIDKQVSMGGVTVDHPVQCVVTIIDVLVHSGGHRNALARTYAIVRPAERKFVIRR